MRTVTFTIPDERPISWNKFYAGMHWSARAEEARRVHMLVRCYCPPEDPFDEPVHIHVKVGFVGRTLDVDNVCTKIYVDGLKGALIGDDSMSYVSSYSVSAEKSKSAYVEITVRVALGADLEYNRGYNQS